LDILADFGVLWIDVNYEDLTCSSN